MNKLAVSVDKLTKFCYEVLRNVGLPEHDAIIVTDTLIFADLRGIHSHGVARLKPYVDRVIRGVTLPVTKISTVNESCSTALLDGGNGFGQVAAVQAMELAINKAKDTGIGFVGVRNSNHIGAASYYTIKAAEKIAIGFATSNAAPAVAPWGGTEAMFGTNPISIAVPAESEPLVLDMACTVVARGKIRLANKKNETIPIGWAFNSKGEPTNSPEEALKGTLMPIGGYKGSNLALMIDVLCGLLTGSKANIDVRRVADLSGPTGIGNVFVAIDIAYFQDVNEFCRKIIQMASRVKNSPKREGVEEVFLPGEPEIRKREQYLVKGIPISMEVLEELTSLGSKFGLEIDLT
jgi:LDH2 family malate/lactate/ureidoglycolate dehydrogenase